MGRKRRYSIPPALLYWLYRGLCSTLRFQEEGRETVDAHNANGQPMVFCLWHDELFPLMRMQRQLDIVTVVSPSRDGDVLAGVLERLGLRTARGSSTRGGANALLSAARLMRDEHVHACVTIDGPRGPRHQAKDGALFLAHHAQALVVPVRLWLHTALRLNSWDRFQVPCPFSQVTVRYGEPWFLPEGELTEATTAHARKRLEADLASLGRGWSSPEGL